MSESPRATVPLRLIVNRYIGALRADDAVTREVFGQVAELAPDLKLPLAQARECARAISAAATLIRQLSKLGPGQELHETAVRAATLHLIVKVMCETQRGRTKRCQ